METKTCGKCSRDLMLDNFCKDKNKKDGLDIYCKECKNAYQKKRRDDNPEGTAERHRKYNRANKEKIADAGKKYRNQRPEKGKERARLYNIAHPERRAEHDRKSREKSVERRRVTYKIWRLENKDKCNIRTQRRTARKKELPSTFTAEQWIQVKRYFNDKCAYCGKELPLEQEHFVALSKGGEYSEDNIIPACRTCNCGKSDKEFFKWYPKQTFHSEDRAKHILDYLGYHDTNQQLSIL